MVAMMDRKLGGFMDGAVGGLVQQAAEARRQGRIAAAEQLLGDALKRQAGEPQALNLLGMIALDRRDFAAASVHFRGAAAADPKEAALWMNVASAERGRGAAEAERAALQAAIDIDQRNLMAQIRMAQLQQRLEERQAAADSWGSLGDS